MVVLIILSLAAFVSAEITQLQWTDCTKNRNSPMKITSMSVTPMPVELPGTMHLSIAGSLLRDLNSVDVKLKLKRNTFLVNLPIPCLMNVGSCDYPDSCVLFKRMMTEDWVGISAGIGKQIELMFRQYNISDTMTCPFKKTAINIQDFQITLPKIPSVLSFLAAGDYSANVQLTENSGGAEILCLDLKLSMKEHKDCSGWFGCGKRRRSAK